MLLTIGFRSIFSNFPHNGDLFDLKLKIENNHNFKVFFDVLSEEGGGGLLDCFECFERNLNIF